MPKPYSLDLRARLEELWKKLGELCDIFSPEECQNYFTHAGYNEKQSSKAMRNTL